MQNKLKHYVSKLIIYPTLLATLLFPNLTHASPLSITELSAFPSQAVTLTTYTGTYKLSGIPGQTVVFKNSFPVGVVQQFDGNVCQPKQRLSASGNCTIKLRFIAPRTSGWVTPTIRACIKNTPTCIFYPISIKITAPLESIAVTPASKTLPKGAVQQFIATARYTDSATSNITSIANWTSGNQTVASVTSYGLAQALTNSGSSTITASYLGISNTAYLEATDKALVSLNITPANITLNKGTSQQLTATGIYTDGTTSNLTLDATWRSSNNIFNVTNGLSTCLASSGTSLISANLTVTASTTLRAAPASLVSISLPPITLNKGRSYQLTATGTYTDNTTSNITNSVNWTSDNTTVATVNRGLVLAKNIGTSSITATNTVSNSTTLTVSPASLTYLTLSPQSVTLPNGASRQFIANGTYSDGSILNITSSVNWTSTNSSVATINTGLATCLLSSGSSTIIAELGVSNTASINASQPGLLAITITPTNATLFRNQTQQFLANGTYTNGVVSNVTTTVNWDSSNEYVANVSSTKGLIIALNSGIANISASSVGITSNKSPLLVVELVSLEITPGSATVNKGYSQQFIATGTYSDNSTANLTALVNWTSSNTSVATINTGLAQVLNVGTATILVNRGNINNTASLIAAPAALISLEITPPSATLNKGLSQQYIATGTFSDNSTANITALTNWSCENTSVANITQGLATVLANSGASNITANLGSIVNFANIFATPASLVSIATTPASVTLNKGLSQSFIATGTYTDNTTANLTTLANWASSNETVATMSEANATVLSNSGTCVISANIGAINNTSILVATTPGLVSIGITPVIVSINKGLSQQFIATGVYTDNSTSNLTGSVVNR
jgi:hypothetical protein